jgi:hypothetical protein
MPPSRTLVAGNTWRDSRIGVTGCRNTGPVSHDKGVLCGLFVNLAESSR